MSEEIVEPVYNTIGSLISDIELGKLPKERVFINIIEGGVYFDLKTDDEEETTDLHCMLITESSTFIKYLLTRLNLDISVCQI